MRAINGGLMVGVFLACSIGWVIPAESAILTVDLDDGGLLLLIAPPLLRGGGQRLLDPLEDDLLVDRLVPADRIDETEQFAVHDRPLR